MRAVYRYCTIAVVLLAINAVASVAYTSYDFAWSWKQPLTHWRVFVPMVWLGLGLIVLLIARQVLTERAALIVPAFAFGGLVLGQLLGVLAGVDDPWHRERQYVLLFLVGAGYFALPAIVVAAVAMLWRMKRTSKGSTNGKSPDQ
jgi:hypothetical protein